MLFQVKIDEARVATAFGRIRAVWQLLWRYLLALVVASFLSLFYFAKYESAGASTGSQTTLPGALVEMVSDLAINAAAAREGLHALMTGQPRGLPEVTAPPSEESHPPQTLRQLLLKVCVVVSISILWFLTFVVADNIRDAWLRNERLRRHPHAVTGLRWLMVFVALLPAVPFILSMRGAYEPAVFVMALIAIFMAAEHYGGLRESKQELEEKTKDITEQLGSVLNADGLAEWRAELYTLYGTARRRIDAVIRYFDIDEAWWRCARNDTPWTDYEKLCKDEPDTLFGALMAEDCKANIQFVCDVPMPPRAEQSPGKLQRAAYFRNLLGLTFNLVVFEKVRRRREEGKKDAVDDDPTARFFPYARIIISHAPSWMHVIDDVVFQVIERGKAEESTVRRLTQGAINPNTRVALNEWARRNVRQFAHRGARAEEYVCAVLRYQAIRHPDVHEDEILNDWALQAILTDLGMDDYLSLPNGEFRILPLAEVTNAPREGLGALLMGRSEAENACVRIFTEFLCQRVSEQGLAVSAPPLGRPTPQDLIYEVM